MRQGDRAVKNEIDRLLEAIQASQAGWIVVSGSWDGFGTTIRWADLPCLGVGNRRMASAPAGGLNDCRHPMQLVR
jgi:hypothetical protein